jgi:endonuclease YncB( thermonuclease family)
MDIETMGLGRGVGIHEIALYNTGDKELTQFLVSPNLTVVKPGKAEQDILKLATSAMDVHQAHPGLQKLIARGEATWKDALVAQVLMAKCTEQGEALGLTVKEIREMPLPKLQAALAAREPIISKWLNEGKYPWLADLESKTRATSWNSAALRRRLTEEGSDVRIATAQNVTIDELFRPGGALSRKLDGQAIWIANANFESKQIGAKLAAIESGAREEFFSKKISRAQYLDKIRSASGLRKVIAETSLNTSDVLAVTGVEVNRARANALISGNWEQVFEAYMKHTGKGDVRDIIDVVRAQQSYSHTLGIMKGKSPHSLSMDVQQRLYGFSIARTKEKAWEALTSKELHAAWADAGITENLVLRESLRQTSALREVSKGTAEGHRLIKEAAQGRGAFHAALRYQAALEEVGKVTQESNLRRRFSQAWLEITESETKTKPGVTHQSSGYRYGAVKRIDNYFGIPHSVPQAIPMPRQQMTSIDDVIAHVKNQGSYKLVDEAAVYSKLEKEFINAEFLDENSKQVIAGNKDKFQITLRKLMNVGSEYIDDHFNKVASSMEPDAAMAYVRGIEQASGTSGRIIAGKPKTWAGWKAMDVKAGRVFRYAGLFAAGMGAAGAFFGHKHDVRRQREGPESLRTMNYERWLSHQANYAGLEQPHQSQSGFSRTGVNASQRTRNSDFGSPYQGPVASSFIFEDQELLRARERYIRDTYNASHYDPAGAIGQYWEKFNLTPGGDSQNLALSVRNLLRSQMTHYTKYQTPSGTSYVDTAGYEGLSRGHLLRVNLNNYKITAEDADTIMLQRKGVTGSMSEFFGFNEPLKVRMGGIDAPETAHAGRAAMPFADNATIALRAMMSGANNLELLVDPKNMTYGRTVGFLFGDGTNLNLEMLRRGSAAYLPFRKAGSKEMYNPAIFSRTEKLAQGADKNMWGLPMYKAYKDIVAASGSRITFNTLVNPEKVAKNAAMMSARALMYSANEMGMYNTAMQSEAAWIGQRIDETNFAADYKTPQLFNWKNTPHKSYIDQLLYESGDLMATKGGYERYQLSHRMGYGNLDKSMALDTLGTTTSIWNKRKLDSYERYNADAFRRRKQDMARLQRYQNKQIFANPTNHHRM